MPKDKRLIQKRNLRKRITLVTFALFHFFYLKNQLLDKLDEF